MDVEKTVQFLLEQQAAFASRMDEMASGMKDLRSVVREMADNQVVLSRTQVHFATNMKDLQGAMGELQDNMRGLQSNMGDLQFRNGRSAPTRLWIAWAFEWTGWYRRWKTVSARTAAPPNSCSVLFFGYPEAVARATAG